MHGFPQGPLIFACKGRRCGYLSWRVAGEDRFADNGDGAATISGTPRKAAAGVYPVALTARNKYGTATQAFTLTIANAR